MGFGNVKRIGFMSIQFVILGLGCSSCKFCLEGEDGWRGDKLVDDDDFFKNDDDFEYFEEEFVSLVFFEDDVWFENEIEDDELQLNVRFIKSGGEFENVFDDEWGFLLSFVDDCLHDNEVEDNEDDVCDKF